MNLILNDIAVGYGRSQVIQGVSLKLASGQCMALIGPNGAGKTTLLNAVSGQRPLTHGQIHYNGSDITHWKAHRRARLGIGRSFQTTHLFAQLSALDNVALAISARQRIGWTQLLSRIPRSTAEQARAFLTEVHLGHDAAKPAHLLSHGDKRKLELAMLLALEPGLLLLDEPTAGMALSDVPAMLDILARLKDSGRYAMLLVEHKLDAVFRLADQIAVLQTGTLLAVGAPGEIISNPQVQAAYLGGSHGTTA